MLTTLLLILANFALSWWVAWGAGRYWTEVKVTGGFGQFFVWTCATVSAVGFTWVYLTLGSLGALLSGLITADSLAAMSGLGAFVLLGNVVGVLLATGSNFLAIAWHNAYLVGDSAEVLTAQAEMHHVMTSARDAPGVFETIGKAVGGDGFDIDFDEAIGCIVFFLIALFAIGGGILTTVAIIRHADRKHAMDVTDPNFAWG